MQSLIVPLLAEHNLLRQALQVLRRISDVVGQGSPLPTDDCATILCFLREFMIAAHFRKESETIFPALTMIGSGLVPHLVGEQFRDQETVRELVGSLALIWEPVAQMTDSERPVFRSIVDALDATCLRMMRREEDELFALVKHLPADDRLGLAAACSDIDSELPENRSWPSRLAVVAKRWA